MRSRPSFSDIFKGCKNQRSTDHIEVSSMPGAILCEGCKSPRWILLSILFSPTFQPTKERLGSSARTKANGTAVFNQYARIRPRTVLVYHRKCQGRAYTLPFVPKNVSSKPDVLVPAFFISNESKNKISRQRVTENQTGALWRMVRYVCRRELSD